MDACVRNIYQSENNKQINCIKNYLHGVPHTSNNYLRISFDGGSPDSESGYPYDHFDISLTPWGFHVKPQFPNAQSIIGPPDQSSIARKL